ncbi:MAG: MFS transporter [Rhodospirillales bacterium]|nr:MFS transporter [Rhodospirillales bacterium]
MEASPERAAEPPPRPRARLPALLAPFAVRSFRFQFPADLLTSWGVEMETLILGWYILAETGSVLLLTLFGALQYLGTLIAPVFGLAGDRVGHRRVLSGMRALFALLAATIAVLALTGILRPLHVLGIAAIAGLVRPSDLAMRNALVAETMPPDRLMATMGVARTTSDSARTLGSLAGAGLFVAIGLGHAYLAITMFYALGFALTLGVGGGRGFAQADAPRAVLRDLREGLEAVWQTPAALAAMLLAFLVNLTAFPLTIGLLPYVAREVYGIGQTGLGTLVASFALGALIGSIAISIMGPRLRPARMMLVFAFAWYAMLLGFVVMPAPTGGRVMLLLAGMAQSFSMVPMSVMLLHGAGARFRGRVMGVRMLAIYGLPIGLMAAGALIDRIGFVATASGYCIVGLALTAAIALRWSAALWPTDAAANLRWMSGSAGSAATR